MDKSLILKEIKTHYNFKTDSEFAEYLGIKQNTLSNWISRNSIDFERIITKCEDISGDWLLTGKGEMLKTAKEKPPNKEIVPEKGEQYLLLLEKNNQNLEKIVALQEEVSILKEKITFLRNRQIQEYPLQWWLNQHKN